MKNLNAFILIACSIISCSRNSKPTHEQLTTDTTGTTVKVGPKHKTLLIPSRIITETLQFIQFDGNYDYWYAYFLRANKDTVRLVTDEDFKLSQVGKLMQVKWKTDTLFEAGEGEKKYSDKRLLSYAVIAGMPYVAPVTEQKVLADINSLPEVKASADKVLVTLKPDFNKPYYQVESSVTNEDNNSKLFTFRVYLFPKYEIKVLDFSNETELSLEQWRLSYKGTTR
jgi:hypothetical protein